MVRAVHRPLPRLPPARGGEIAAGDAPASCPRGAGEGRIDQLAGHRHHIDIGRQHAGLLQRLAGLDDGLRLLVADRAAGQVVAFQLRAPRPRRAASSPPPSAPSGPPDAPPTSAGPARRWPARGAPDRDSPRRTPRARSARPRCWRRRCDRTAARRFRSRPRPSSDRGRPRQRRRRVPARCGRRDAAAAPASRRARVSPAVASARTRKMCGSVPRVTAMRWPLQVRHGVDRAVLHGDQRGPLGARVHIDRP